jgi:hypothetical protein
MDGTVYMSARKSMTVHAFIHSISKRAEVVALIEPGATENFMNLQYTKWLQLPQAWPLYNIDGTENKSGTLQYYTDLAIQTGAHTVNMRFFLTDLGDHKAILGYPWFAVMQPNIDWK